MRKYMRRKKLKKIVRYDPNTGILYSRKTEKDVIDSNGQVIKELGEPVGVIDINGHVQLRINGGIRYKADELIWFYVYGEWPKHPIIHINGVNSDNWLSNLKMVPAIKKRKNSKSGVTGVSRDKRDKKWRSTLTVWGEQYNLGNYENFDLAVLARFKAEQKHGLEPNSTAHQYLKKMFL